MYGSFVFIFKFCIAPLVGFLWQWPSCHRSRAPRGLSPSLWSRRGAGGGVWIRNTIRNKMWDKFPNPPPHPHLGISAYFYRFEKEAIFWGGVLIRNQKQDYVGQIPIWKFPHLFTDIFLKWLFFGLLNWKKAETMELIWVWPHLRWGWWSKDVIKLSGTRETWFKVFLLQTAYLINTNMARPGRISSTIFPMEVQLKRCLCNESFCNVIIGKGAWKL